ncbi:hypothetical protein [Cytobacillus oceanisediminis]|uniref:hypothetical protein n=1 Tax=Cytobacillus oceanisediminis TaxID=665099 RepID=UPI0024943590|nr:hypothetical protein [Cytobacillus oceanisediminis]
MLPKSLEAELVKGNKYLRSVLTEAVQSVRGSKNYLGASYRRTPVEKERNMQPS